MKNLQITFKSEIALTDTEGNKIYFDTFAMSPIQEIKRFLNCSKKKALEVLKKLQKNYDIYTNTNQIVLARNGKIIHNFELYGNTYYNGHKYNNVNKWDFINFVNKAKSPKTRQVKQAKQPKITATELQIKRANQIYYASKIGFDVDYNDYKRFYLVA